MKFILSLRNTLRLRHQSFVLGINHVGTELFLKNCLPLLSVTKVGSASETERHPLSSIPKWAPSHRLSGTVLPLASGGETLCYCRAESNQAVRSRPGRCGSGRIASGGAGAPGRTPGSAQPGLPERWVRGAAGKAPGTSSCFGRAFPRLGSLEAGNVAPCFAPLSVLPSLTQDFPGSSWRRPKKGSVKNPFFRRERDL